MHLNICIRVKTVDPQITAKVFPYWKKNDPDLSVFQVSNGVWFGVKPRVSTKLT